jgi:hypothetical protein
MKGIYLTKEAKEEIETKIKKLDVLKREPDTILTFNEYQRIIDVYKEMLSSAIILPVYSDWDEVDNFPPDNESQNKKTLELKHGVVIQSK